MKPVESQGRHWRVIDYLLDYFTQRSERTNKTCAFASECVGLYLGVGRQRAESQCSTYYNTRKKHYLYTIII